MHIWQATKVLKLQEGIHSPHRVGYQEKNRIFEIVFLEIINEKTVIDCHQAFRECFEKNFRGQEFKILLDTRGCRHESLAADRAMRELFSGTWKPEEYEKCVACAIVNDDYPELNILKNIQFIRAAIYELYNLLPLDFQR